MATPANLLAAAQAAGAAGAASRRFATPRPMAATAGSAPGDVATLDAGGPDSATVQPLGGMSLSFPGFRPMGGGMPAPPAAPMAQGREVVEQDGQQGVMGAGGRFQPLGDAALSKLDAGGTFGGGSGGFAGPRSGGIVADDFTRPLPPPPGGPGGMPGFRAMPSSPYQRQPGGGRTDVGGGKLQALRSAGFGPGANANTEEINVPSKGISNSGEIQGDGARGMSSIGSAVGRAMRPRPTRSAVSREGAAPGY